jgi:[NiFe] hydrogenase diaphorase moiety small subunit
MTQQSILLDGLPVPFEEGQTIMDAAMAAEIFIPHLCHHPEFKPQGSCKLCTVKANGRYVSACTMPAKDGMEVENNSPDLNDKRRTMLQMLFVEGNHFCPSCEKSGNCMLQALAYELEMLSPHFNQFYPNRPLDASHPRGAARLQSLHSLRAVRARQPRRRWQERLCALRAGHHQAPDRQCRVRAAGRYRFSLTDKAAHVCPVGVILEKRKGFAVPIGSVATMSSRSACRSSAWRNRTRPRRRLR